MSLTIRMSSQNIYYPRGDPSNIGMYGAPPESNENKINRLVAEIGDTNSKPDKIARYNEIISVSQAAIDSLNQEQNGGKRRKTRKNKKTRSK